MSVAADLFYNQGYRATGVNEVIEKSGVAKATFYHHFPAKYDLGLAYLKYTRKDELAYLDNYLASRTRPLDRFLAIMESLGPWMVDTDFRGCAFINMASEVPDPGSPMRKEGTMLYDAIRERVKTLSEELIASDRVKYGHLDVRELTNDFMVIFVGAVALSELYHDIWPAEHALSSVRRLVGA
ncbi:MAG: TetR/AcrR family transcriptional regulator [Leptospirillia bacterium]